jgi:hypothetical protein
MHKVNEFRTILFTHNNIGFENNPIVLNTVLYRRNKFQLYKEIRIYYIIMNTLKIKTQTLNQFNFQFIEKVRTHQLACCELCKKPLEPYVEDGWHNYDSLHQKCFVQEYYRLKKMEKRIKAVLD